VEILDKLESLTNCLRLPNEPTYTFVKRLVTEVDVSFSDEDWYKLDTKIRSYINSVIINIRRKGNAD
jgi:hypothetical protein